MKKIYTNIREWYSKDGKGTLLKILRVLSLISSIALLALGIVLFFIGLFLFRSFGFAIAYFLLSLLFSLLLLIAAAMYHGEEDLFYKLKTLEKEKNTNALKNKDNNTLDAKIQLLWDKVNSIESTVNNKDEKDQ